MLKLPLNPNPIKSRQQNGTTLIEVLITILVLAFGLLGLAGMLNQTQKIEYESFQRSQAVLLMTEMTDRISANRANASSYVTPIAVGGAGAIADCSTSVAIVDRDLCDWTNALLGATEKKGTASVGAMTAARGCITQLRAPDPTAGNCVPGTYQVSVAWQGLYPTKAQLNDCGKDQYGSDDSYRRSISSQISVSLPVC